MRAVGKTDFAVFDWEAVEHSHRRHLPHLSQRGVIYFVTFRLADSLPQKMLRRWLDERAAWCNAHPEPWDEPARQEHKRLFTARMERWLDAGYGDCVLRDAKCRHELVERLWFKQGADYDLGDWVVMPNHVHVLIQLLKNVPLQDILKPIKGVSARNINRLLGRAGVLWMEEPFSHIVRSVEQLKKIQCYIRQNPVKAGLAAAEFSYEQRWEVV